MGLPLATGDKTVCYPSGQKREGHEDGEVRELPRAKAFLPQRLDEAEENAACYGNEKAGNA